MERLGTLATPVRQIKYGALAAGSMIALALAWPAAAQSSSPAGKDTKTGTTDTAIQDIVVTAQFRAQRLQDTPIAITAETGAMLAQRGVTNLTNLKTVTPNLNISASSPVFGNSISVFIRGIGQYDNNFAYEPGVGIYLDDVYYGVITGADFQLADLDRVEVLRGPQGTLSGKNSLGGAIKLYSKKPDGSNEGYIEGTYGSYNRIDVRGAFDLGLVRDKLFLRVSGFSTRRDGYLTLLDFRCADPAAAGDIPLIGGGNSCKTGSEGGKNLWGVRAALRWLPTSNIEANLSFDRTVDTSEPAASSLFYAYTPFGPVTYNPGNPNSTPYDSRFIPSNPYTSYSTYKDANTGFTLSPTTSTKAWGVTGDVRWDLGSGLTLRSISAYRSFRTIDNFDQDGSPLDLSLVHIDNKYHQFTQEVRLSGKINTFANWTVGGFYYDADGLILNRISAPPTLDFITHDPVKTTSKSVFGHLVLHPFTNFNITAGIRYTDDKKTYDFNRTGPNGPPSQNLEALNLLPLQKYKGSHTDYRIGVDYRWNESLLTYAQFSTGYKGGGVNPKPFTAGQALPFGPEKLDAYEIGLKSDLFDRRLRFNAAAFYSKYKDIILINAAGYCGIGDDPTGPCSFQSALPFNAGDADIKGLEGEIDFHPIEGLTFSGSASYLHFKYTRLAAAAVMSGITYDDVPPFTPKWKWSGGVAYAIPLGNIGTFTPRVDVEHTSKTFFDPANHGFDALAGTELYLVPAYTTAKARITFDSADGNWQASVSVDNLTNKYYYTSGFAFYYTGTGQHIVAPPREWAFTLRRKF